MTFAEIMRSFFAGWIQYKANVYRPTEGVLFPNECRTKARSWASTNHLHSEIRLTIFCGLPKAFLKVYERACTLLDLSLVILLCRWARCTLLHTCIQLFTVFIQSFQSFSSHQCHFEQSALRHWKPSHFPLWRGSRSINFQPSLLSHLSSDGELLDRGKAY